MKIWWVIGWDDYYPTSDNFKGSFSTREEARDWIVKAKKESFPCDYYAVIDISGRL